MDIYKVKWTSLQSGVFSLLCVRAEEKLSQREIAKLLSVSPTAVGLALAGLGDLVKVEKMKTINLISFNRENRRARELKRAENLKNTYISGLSDLLERELPGGTIIVFGSYSLGEDTSASDIDIAVIGRKEKKINVESYEKVLRRKIRINFFPSWKIQEHLRNNILNGILLHGGVEL